MADKAQKVAEFIELRAEGDKVPRVCARVTHHFEQGQTIAVHTDDPAEAREIDEQLWSFRQNSFVPHVRREEAEDPVLEPVIIFSGDADGLTADVLVLASADGIPDWVGAFPHVYEFAPIYDEGLRGAARQRFAAYQKAGYRMRFIKADSQE
jgi:DNA polymerase-3 subunit chi